MEETGLTVQRFIEEDPGFVSTKQSSVVHIPTHFLIHLENKTQPLIHLVIFHTRKDSYFWYSGIVLHKHPEHVIPKITFAQTSGAYDRYMTFKHLYFRYSALEPMGLLHVSLTSLTNAYYFEKYHGNSRLTTNYLS